MHLSFEWRRPSGVTEARIRLIRTAEPPRPAGYGFDDSWVDREIRDPGYRMFFRTRDGRETNVPDPTVLCVENFLHAVKVGRPSKIRVDEIQRLAALEAFARVTGHEKDDPTA